MNGLVPSTSSDFSVDPSIRSAFSVSLSDGNTLSRRASISIGAVKYDLQEHHGILYPYVQGCQLNILSMIAFISYYILAQEFCRNESESTKCRFLRRDIEVGQGSVNYQILPNLPSWLRSC